MARALTVLSALRAIFSVWARGATPQAKRAQLGHAREETRTCRLQLPTCSERLQAGVNARPC
eukprot:11046295-Alexandrium_andersonii.AAC.1